MLGEASEVVRRAIVELTNLPSCAADCYAAVATSTNSYSCDIVSNSASLERCLIHACSLPEAIVARNATETACGTPSNNDSTQFFVINIVFGLLTAGIVAIRLGHRAFFSPRRGFLDADDLLILIASPIAIASLTTILVGLWGNGISKDVWAVKADELVNFGLYLYIMEILYLLLLTLIKLTLSVFYLAIFPGTTIRRLLWGTIIFHIAFGIAFLFKGSFQCTPVDYSWLRYDTAHASTVNGHCVNINASGWVNAGVNVAMDFWLIAIPMTQLRKLRLHWKKKVGAAFMLMTGLLVTVVSILRLNSLRKYAITTNPTHDQYSVVLWSVIEVSIGMLCTCLPSMRLVLLRLWPVVFGQTPQPSRDRFSRQGPSGQPSKNSSSKSPPLTQEYDLEDATAILTEPPDAFYSATRGSWSVDLERVYSEASNRPHDERIGTKAPR